MKQIYCGIDFHKRTSTIFAMDQSGARVELTTIHSDRLVQYLANRKDYHIGIEASGGVNHVAEALVGAGHRVTILDPKKIRGIAVKNNKTDEKDAEVLAQALRMNFCGEVYLRSRASRHLKSYLVSRELVVRSRVNMTNHLRGTLREYGFVIPQGVDSFFKLVRGQIAQIECGFLKKQLLFVLDKAIELKAQEQELETEIKRILSESMVAKNLQTIPGIGPMTAAAMLAVVDDIARFKSAKLFASYLGLTPREFSSGDKRRMGAITRSGPEMLRRYLIHGSRAVLRFANEASTDRNVAWALRLQGRVGTNKAVVALAHRLSRVAYAVIRDGQGYTQGQSAVPEKTTAA